MKTNQPENASTLVFQLVCLVLIFKQCHRTSLVNGPSLRKVRYVIVSHQEDSWAGLWAFSLYFHQFPYNSCCFKWLNTRLKATRWAWDLWCGSLHWDIVEVFSAYNIERIFELLLLFQSLGSSVVSSQWLQQKKKKKNQKCSNL